MKQKTYTVTVENKYGEKWNELANKIEFFTKNGQGRIALRNPFEDDEVLDPDFESIVYIEPGVVDNGFPWFHEDGEEEPLQASDVLLEDEQWSAKPFR